MCLGVDLGSSGCAPKEFSQGKGEFSEGCKFTHRGEGGPQNLDVPLEINQIEFTSRSSQNFIQA